MSAVDDGAERHMRSDQTLYRFLALIEKYGAGDFSISRYGNGGWTAMLEYPMPGGDGSARFVGQSGDPEGAIAALLADMGVVA